MVNAGAQKGLEAWRALVLHHEPTSLTRSAGLLQEILNFSSEGETAARMAQFDRDIDRNRNEKASGETFPENIRIGVAVTHVAGRTVETTPCPQQCSVDHVGNTEGRDRQCQTSAQAAASSTPQPMDLSAYGTQELDSFQRGQVEPQRQGGRTKANSRTIFRRCYV